VLGAGGVGVSDEREIVLQVVTRGRGKNAAENELVGWTPDGPCSPSEMDSLKGILEDKKGRQPRVFGGDVTSSFNLDLTAEQRESRAKVPLPYAHKEKGGAIFYDPDSADDIDDDDPDEDLDI